MQAAPSDMPRSAPSILPPMASPAAPAWKQEAPKPEGGETEGGKE